MSKTSDNVALEPEPAESYAGIATRTRSNGKAPMTELNNPKSLTIKEVDLKLSAFMDESRRQFSVVLELLRGGTADQAEGNSAR